jgi:hypothetical protein
VNQLKPGKIQGVQLSMDKHADNVPLTAAAIRPVPFNNTEQLVQHVTLLAILALGLQILNAGPALYVIL